MNDEDKKILELYLKDRKKHHIVSALILIVILMLIGYYIIYIQQYKLKTCRSNENELDYNDITNEIVEVSSQNKIEEIYTNTIEEQKNIESNVKTEVKNITKETKNQNEDSKDTKKVKKANKEFLFKDGYNMQNVTKVAQDYLKSSGYPGKCIPIKDDEGVCIGMKVIFD